ncbi:class I SAM-dependent methyltransferase [Actinomadura rugatobispora]|uniref:Methyltransferase domain-containing protein n=1 Tax=Actinomadura rugatobispora TaxID=1994 RepID=A0ABW1A4W9_9ACTN|nr:hypothetical protein GCM10010200_052700 [Actinomadura rugatobispora]
MPHPATMTEEPGAPIAPHLRRLLEFTEPAGDDVCLDVARGQGPMPEALGPQVRHVTAVDALPRRSAGRDGGGRMATVTFGTGPVRIAGDPVPPPGHGARPGPDPRAQAGAQAPRTQDPRAQAGAQAPRAQDPRAQAPRGRDPRGHDHPHGGDGRGSAVTAHDGDLLRPPRGRAAILRRGTPDPVRVRADATALPYRDGSFTLVTARFSLFSLGDPNRVLRELLRVCRPGGRLIIADLVRGNLAQPDRDRIERLRDPDHPGTPSIAAITDMITSAGASIRRLDVFTVERPLEPWLAGARDPRAADRIRAALLDEVDGGPRTGAKPRVIGGELWFTQSWAHVAAEPI